jgi:hypothetical protein
MHVNDLGLEVAEDINFEPKGSSELRPKIVEQKNMLKKIRLIEDDETTRPNGFSGQKTPN